jgi:hypothetical protein
VYVQRKENRFYTTILALNMASGQTGSPTDLQKEGYIIVETNYRVYAYTDSNLQVALLALFCEMLYRSEQYNTLLMLSSPKVFIYFVEFIMLCGEIKGNPCLVLMNSFLALSPLSGSVEMFPGGIMSSDSGNSHFTVS